MPEVVPPPRPLPEHVTTPLLTLITTRSMDEDYAHVARRRQAAGKSSPAPRRGSWPSVTALVAFGVLVAIAGVQTARDADVQELGRAALIGQIQSQRDQLGDLQRRVAELSRSTQALSGHTSALARQQDGLDAAIERLEVRTGFSAVHGEGVRITVDNRPGVDVNSEIRDEDLATLVDGLWEAGAEAIAIDDERINVLGGIRNVNRAIHVNGHPVEAPYVVTAIGDNATLQARLQETSEGQAFQALVNGLGFVYRVDNVDDVRLPAGALRPLRFAVDAGTRPGGEEEAP
jgi:uncharacterized protein YlxW (UPF0749 family)